ncbi:helix-turn-helix domain-containing protein [Ureibacillus sp. GCM10028918]|uniref:helix-turn-helix domain-containing protein n=1 Tax=Ureibacillus sp. GCM10028918 TaxID=3273429 RepID=UPI003606050D
MVIEVKLEALLEERKLKQYQLSKMTGLTTRTISGLVNNKMERIPIKAICKIAEGLKIEDIVEIMDFKK